MRRLALGFVFSLALFVSATAPAYAANLPLLDPNFTIVPTQCTACPCGWGGVLQLAQNLMNVGISIGVIAFVLVAAYAGFQFMVNPTNPEARNQAKSMLFNVVIGMFIVLSAWLIVDFIMKTLYNSGSSYGPWNSILKDTSGSQCIQQTSPTSIGTGFPNAFINAVAGVGHAGPLCLTGACSTQSLKGLGLTDAQANAMSCIAMTESSGIPTKVNSTSQACGLFQITNKTGASNWQTAANHGPGCSVSTSCTDATCNAQTAVILFNKQSYQPWTGKCTNPSGCGSTPYGQNWNPNAVACVQKYDPGH